MRNLLAFCLILLLNGILSANDTIQIKIEDRESGIIGKFPTQNYGINYYLFSNYFDFISKAAKSKQLGIGDNPTFGFYWIYKVTKFNAVGLEIMLPLDWSKINYFPSDEQIIHQEIIDRYKKGFSIGSDIHHPSAEDYRTYKLYTQLKYLCNVHCTLHAHKNWHGLNMCIGIEYGQYDYLLAESKFYGNYILVKSIDWGNYVGNDLFGSYEGKEDHYKVDGIIRENVYRGTTDVLNLRAGFSYAHPIFKQLSYGFSLEAVYNLNINSTLLEQVKVLHLEPKVSLGFLL